MHTKYKLSICIPTYNRSKYLPELLDSILSQPEASKVEIAISDNASTDNTEELIKAYQEKHENIVYLKLAENLGPDRNYFKAVEISSGQYAWLMGSDDKLADGSLALVLHEIESGKDIYLQDRIECDINMNVIKRRSWWKTDTKENWDFSVDNIGDYLSTCTSLGGVFSYLSSIVVLKNKWKRYKPNDKYFSTGYSHVFPLLSILFNEGTLKLINKSGVNSRGGNDFFSKNGDCKRRLIDFEGYSMLAIDFKHQELMFLLKVEHGYVGLSTLFKGCVERRKVINYALRAGFNSSQILISFIRGTLIKIIR